MRVLLTYLRKYITDHFNGPIYAFTAVWLVIIFSINYTYDFEDSIIDTIPEYWSRVVAFFFFHSIPFAVPAFFMARYKKSKVLVSNVFWMKVLAVFAVLAIYRSMHMYSWFCDIVSFEDCRFPYSVFRRFVRMVIFLVPLVLFFPMDRKHLRSFYGLDFRITSIRPYLPMLLVMAVIIFIAAIFSDDLQRYYPLYAKSGGDDFSMIHQLPEWVTVLLYESSYLFNFISIEFFFRGFMILAFVRLFGPQIVLPVVCLYASIHFGKPFLESLGSVFGGYILGILTYKTENIWGGVVVHAGTALFMELFAWLI
jgi:hypothetical protein